MMLVKRPASLSTPDDSFLFDADAAEHCSKQNGETNEGVPRLNCERSTKVNHCKRFVQLSHVKFRRKGGFVERS